MKKTLLSIAVFSIFALFSVNQVNAQCAAGEVEITFNLTTDDNPSETTFSLVDDAGLILAESGGANYGANTVYTYQACVPEYTNVTLSVSDIGANGLNNPGGFEILTDCGTGSGTGIISEFAWADANYAATFEASCSGSGTILTYGCTDPLATNYDPNADIDDGSCVDCNENIIGLTFFQGSYSYECAYEVTNITTGVVETSTGILNTTGAQNTAAYDYSVASHTKTLCLTDDCYKIQLTDAYGDGWNGATFELVDLVTGALIYSGTVASGGTIQEDYISLGSASCPVFGCTDPAAANYDPAATADDNSCAYPPACNPLAAPICESFEGGSMIFTDWSNGLDDMDWVVNSGSTGSSGTGPSQASDGTTYIYLETSSSDSGDVAIMSACFDITGVSNPELTFDYHMFGSDMGTLTFVVEAAGAQDTAWSLSGDQADMWHNGSIDLGPYSFAGVVTIIIYGMDDVSYTSDIALDNICVKDASVIFGCTDPAASNYNPMATNDDASCCYGGEYAIVTDIFSSESWELLDASGTVVASGDYMTDSMIYCLDTMCYTLNMYDDFSGGWSEPLEIYEFDATGSGTLIHSSIMSSGTMLEIDVIDLFGLGDCIGGCTDSTALNYDPNATTNDGSCVYPAIAPYCEDFASNSGIFTNGSMGWSHGATNTPSFGTGPDALGDADGGSGFMFVEASSPNYPNVGPFELTVNMDLSSLMQPAILFDYHMYGGGLPGAMGTLEVIVDGNVLWSMSDDQGDMWHSAVVSLAGYTGSVDVTFSGVTGTSYEGDMSIDNVCFDEDPCAGTVWSFNISTTDESAAAMGDGSAQVDASGGNGGEEWTLYNSAGTILGTGSGTNLTASGLFPGTYDFTFSDQNDCSESGQFTINPGAGDPCDNTNIALSAIGSEIVNCGTDGSVFASATGGQTGVTGGYTYNIYDAMGNFLETGSGTTWTFTNLVPGNYIVDAIDDNGCADTTTSDVTLFTGYCTAGASSTWEFISSVSYSNVVNTSGYFPGVAYEDYTSISGDVLEGSTMDVEVDISVHWSADALGIWVDWNDDYCFDPYTEEYTLMTTGPAAANGVATETISIPVPMGAIGSHLMRIRVVDASVDPLEPCNWLQWGETEDYTVNVISDPCAATTVSVTIAATDETSFGANDGTATATATGGNGNYTYSWDNGSMGSALTTLAPGTYTVTASDDFGCTGTASATINPGPQEGIVGTLKYANSFATPMEAVIIELVDNAGNVTNSAVTDPSGYFEMWQTSAGDYTMVENHGKAHGGVNTTDALVVQLHSIFSDTISHHLLLEAADVNNSGYINSSDALNVRLRFIQSITSFDIPDWLYDEDVLTHTGGVMTHDYEAACAGDVNGSYVPPALRMPSASFELSDDYVVVDSRDEFTLPVRLSKDVELGAVSLVLNYPSSSLDLQGVTMAVGNDEDLMWSVEGDEIRISWMNTNPISVNANQDLFNLVFKSNDLTPGQNIEISMGELDTEFANAVAHVINDIEVSTPQIRVIIEGELAPVFTSYPSPFTNNSTIEYTLAVDGYVNLYMFNTLGELVQKVEEGIETRVKKDAGNYKFTLDGTGLDNGMYMYVIEVETAEDTYIKTIRTVKSLK